MDNRWKKQFALIYSGQAFSLVGSAAVQFAVIWWITVKTESAITLTIATIVAFIPTMVISPFAGVIVDRINRRIIMMCADGFVGLVSAVLGLVFLSTDTPSLGFLYAILFLRGLGSAFHQPALQAATPQLVPADMLVKAGGWANLVASAAQMLGPVLGAALMAFMPMAAIVFIDTIGAAIAVDTLAFVRIPDVERDGSPARVIGDLKEGLVAMRGNPAFMASVAPLGLVMLLFMPLGSLFPLLVRVGFNGDAWDNSMVELAFSLGLGVASAVLGVWGGKRRRFTLISAACVLLGLMSVVGGLLPPEGFWIFVACSFVMGLAGTAFNVPFMAYLQESFAPDVLGKVFALWMSLISLAMPIGLLVAGPVSEAVGVSTWFWASGIAVALAGAWAWWVLRHHDVAAIELAGADDAVADPALSGAVGSEPAAQDSVVDEGGAQAV